MKRPSLLLVFFAEGRLLPLSSSSWASYPLSLLSDVSGLLSAFCAL